eukprot:3051058-Rhodomonas_salina.1
MEEDEEAGGGALLRALSEVLISQLRVEIEGRARSEGSASQLFDLLGRRRTWKGREGNRRRDGR